MRSPDLASFPRVRAAGRLRACLFLASLLVAGAASAQADASIDQVYQAARAGHLDQAQQMMAPVLRDHPQSAKAHYVEAELLARQGRRAPARAELATAERLAPGLPFAHADAVQALRRELGDTGSAAPARAADPMPPTLTPAAHVPAPAGGAYGGIAAAVLGGALLAWLLTRLGRPQPSAPPLAPPGALLPAAAGGLPGAVAGAWPPAMAAPAPAPAGIGHSLAGGLATGLAAGAGLVAAETLGHRLFGDPAPAYRVPEPTAFATVSPPFPPDAGTIDPRMGGNDFGIDDAGSWDDDATGGGWDS